jgi:hypothetical protein
MAFVCGAIQRHKGPMSCGCKLIMKLMGFHKTHTMLFSGRRAESDSMGSKGVVMGAEPVTAAGGGGGGGGAHSRANGSGVAGCDQRA